MSGVWKYYKIESEGSVTARCNVCKVEAPRGGKNRATFNTTNLIRHLRNKHQQQHDEYTAATQVTKQPTLSETFKRKEKLPQNSEKAQNITAKIAEFIALDDQPLSVTFFFS